MMISVSTGPGPGPGPGPLRSNIASFRSGLETFFRTGLDLCAAFALLFCLFHINHTSHQPQKGN